MLNSKRCSTADRPFHSFFKACCAFALIASFCASSALAATPPLRATLEKDIHSFMQARNGGSFDSLLDRWQDRYGSSPSKAVGSLIHLASNAKLQDSERYVALMGAARLGGTQSAPLLSRFLKDRSWMIRNGALRALTALKNPKTSAHVLPLLRDPALVVRAEAVEAVRVLKPAGAADALVRAALASENFHAGKAQWVPQKALQALVELNAGLHAPRLAPLLDKKSDPSIQREAIATLRKLRGKSPADSALPLSDQVSLWKAELAQGSSQASK